MAESLQVECWWWLCHRGQGWHGRARRAAWASRDWCPWQWGVAASPLLVLLSDTSGCFDGVKPDRVTLLSSASWYSIGECCKFLKGYWPKDKQTLTVPVCTLSGFYRHLENLCNPNKRSSTLFSLSVRIRVKLAIKFLIHEPIGCFWFMLSFLLLLKTFEPFVFHSDCISLNSLGKGPPLPGFSIQTRSSRVRTHLSISFTQFLFFFLVIAFQLYRETCYLTTKLLFLPHKLRVSCHSLLFHALYLMRKARLGTLTWVSQGYFWKICEDRK